MSNQLWKLWIVLVVMAISVTTLRGEEADDADEVRAVRAENKLLRSTLQARDETISKLKDEIRTLENRPLQQEIDRLKEELAAAQKKVAGVTSENKELAKKVDALTPPKTNPSTGNQNDVKQYELTEIAGMDLEDVEALVGSQVHGSGDIQKAYADRDNPKQYTVEVKMDYRGSNWVRLRTQAVAGIKVVCSQPSSNIENIMEPW